jgi:hypothetical protein
MAVNETFDGKRRRAMTLLPQHPSACRGIERNSGGLSVCRAERAPANEGRHQQHRAQSRRNGQRQKCRKEAGRKRKPGRFVRLKMGKAIGTANAAKS